MRWTDKNGVRDEERYSIADEAVEKHDASGEVVFTRGSSITEWMQGRDQGRNKGRSREGPGEVQGRSREGPGEIQGRSKEGPGKIQGRSRKIQGGPEEVREGPGEVQGRSREGPGKVQGRSRGRFGFQQRVEEWIQGWVQRRTPGQTQEKIQGRGEEWIQGMDQGKESWRRPSRGMNTGVISCGKIQGFTNWSPGLI